MKKVLLSFLCAVFVSPVLWAGSVAADDGIAVFRIDSGDSELPGGSLELAESLIIEALAVYRQFRVYDAGESLSAEELEALLAGDDSSPEPGALKGADFLVVPGLSVYEAAECGEDGELEAEIQFSFSLIRTDGMVEAARFAVNAYGQGETEVEAADAAVRAAAVQLGFELRKIEEFVLKSSVIEVLGNGEVIIGLGRESGIVCGDELAFEVGKDGAGGLIVINRSEEDLSYGTVISRSDDVVPGARVDLVPRFGADLSPYARAFFDESGISPGCAGLRFVPVKGFYDLRPVAGIEVPLVADFIGGQWPGFPVSVYAGFELFWILGRLQIEPAFVFGLTSLVPIRAAEQFRISHAGGTAALTFNWMLFENLRIFAEGGYSYWYSTAASELPEVKAFGGIFGGIGVTFKL